MVSFVGTGSAGEADGPFTEKAHMRFQLHGFATLPHQAGESTRTTPVSVFGYTWFLEVWPGGYGPDGHMSVYLFVADGATPSAKYTLRIRGADYLCVGDRDTYFSTTGARKYEAGQGCGWAAFGDRADYISKCLVHGTLTIEVDIQVRSRAPQQWAPKTSLSADWLRLLASGDGADVAFVVGEERIAAHRLVLGMRAPTLAALCVDGGGDVEIGDVDVATFKALLTFAYSDVLEPPATKAEARSLLDAADRFGCVALKLHAEAELVKQGVAVDEAAELLLFADAHSYPQLKETAKDVCVANLQAVMATEGWQKVDESNKLLREVLQSVGSVASGCTAAVDEDDDPKTMRVVQLRRALEEKGLDCDGPRELLEKRLRDPPDKATPGSARKRARLG